CRQWLVLPCSPTPFRSARPPWLQLPGTSGLKMSDPADQLQKWLFIDSNVSQPHSFFKHLF
ncbi:MAG: hypothetical protein ABWX85_10235, partial [Arthrobacter sp.]